MAKVTQSAPKILIILATHNGSLWIDEQLLSMSKQEDVKIFLLINDDDSNDDTSLKTINAVNQYKINANLAHNSTGSAASNFFHLISSVDQNLFGISYVAICDQDDIWHPDKLARAVEAIGSGRCEAVSTSVMAFWPDGRRKLVDKGQHLRPADHWFESAGPGCTYVLRADVAQELSGWVAAHREALRGIDFHDWLVYAWARSRDYRWWIDPRPSMDYRQHSHNVLGAHAGLAGITKRLRMLLGGWYLQQVLRIADVCDANNQPLIARLRRDRWYDRLALVLQVGQMRRKPLDRLALAIALLFGRRSPP